MGDRGEVGDGMSSRLVLRVDGVVSPPKSTLGSGVCLDGVRFFSFTETGVTATVPWLVFAMDNRTSSSATFRCHVPEPETLAALDDPTTLFLRRCSCVGECDAPRVGRVLGVAVWEDEDPGVAGSSNAVSSPGELFRCFWSRDDGGVRYG